LATPTAVSVGLGLANLRGIIIKKASTFEAINEASVCIFDKTGTLTTGEIQFELFLEDTSFNEKQIWSYIYELEKHSSHPIARSLIESAGSNTETQVEDPREIKGKGMIAQLENKELRFGSSSFTSQTGDGDLFLTLDNKLIAYLIKKEELKTEAKSVIQRIKLAHKNVILLSGDSLRKTKEIADMLEIEDFFGDQLPEEKLTFIKNKQKNNKVIMMGDGINDAPALSASSVGISIGTNNALASESASVVIVGSSLDRLTDLLKISSSVVRTIRQNLFWAFSYNLIAIPLAALGFLDPMLAALSMAFSDVVVIGNSLRLKLALPKTLD